jgi:hypothetical protein
MNYKQFLLLTKNNDTFLENHQTKFKNVRYSF